MENNVLNFENNPLNFVDTKDIVLCAYEVEGVVKFGYFTCKYYDRGYKDGSKVLLLRGFDN